MLKPIRYVLFVLSLSALLLACGKDDGKEKPAAEPKAAPAAATPAAETNEGAPTKAATAPSGVVPKVEKLSEKACDCKTKKCANGVQDELAALMGEMANVQANEREPIATAMQKLQKCLAEAQQ